MTREKASRKQKEVRLFIKLLFEEAGPNLTETEFEAFVISLLVSLHGQVGASMIMELIAYQQNSAHVLLQNESDLNKLWSTLTLCGHFDGKRCMFETKQIVEPS